MRFLSVSVFAALLSAPAFAADVGTYRPGTPYQSAVAAGADVCDSQCAGDAQCRGWNYVKPNPQAPGICEYLSSVAAPISSQISISGENISASSFSSRVTSGGINTVRVGTQPSREANTVKVGQPPSRRRVVRQAPPQRITTQSVSTQPVENMSLTAQQNRYRQGAVRPQPPQIQARAQHATAQRAAAQHQPMFRPILDAPAAQRSAQPAYQPQTQQPKIQQQKRQSRRMTGPRRAVSPQQNAAPAQPQNYAAYGQPAPAPRPVPRPVQRPVQAQAPGAQSRGQSRPPVGQPIPASQPTPRPRRSTPSQRLAQFTAQNAATAPVVSSESPMSLTPQQAQRSLFGRLNDDIEAPADLPTASAVPTAPVTEQPLGEVLAGGR